MRNQLIKRIKPDNLRRDPVFPSSIDREINSVKDNILTASDLSEKRVHCFRKVMVCGGPGSGKSMCAEHLAHITNFPLLTVRDEALFGKPKHVFEVINRAFKSTMNRKCILFLEDKRRKLGLDDNMVNWFANILEGFEFTQGLVIIEKNQSNKIDDRENQANSDIYFRFDKVISIPNPDFNETRLLISKRLSSFATGAINWNSVNSLVESTQLSALQVTKVAEEVGRIAISKGIDELSTQDITYVLKKWYYRN